MSAAEARPVSAAETKQLFSGFEKATGLLLAVSGGPDSVALMLLAARWRGGRKSLPKLSAATVDHGLRKEAHREALAVSRLARKLGIPHRILRWTGRKPKTGLQQAARAARYRLLIEAAKKAGASHIVTAHTLDDQAETVLMRMARGSGIGGLGAMARQSAFDGFPVLRPLLGIAKARLIATARKAKAPFADDVSNRDPRFTRSRWRAVMPELAREGLDSRRLSQLAGRLRRANDALEAYAGRAAADLALGPASDGVLRFDAPNFFALPAETGIRVLRRAVEKTGNEGPVELGKLEALWGAAREAKKAQKRQFRRTLAGAMVTVTDREMTVEQAPARRRNPLTKGRTGPAAPPKAR